MLVFDGKNSLWQRFINSGILSKAAEKEATTRIAEAGVNLTSDPDVLNWMSQNKLGTSYQRRVLAAGGDGPFVFGDYAVLGVIENGPLVGTFSGVHRTTGFNVCLDFFDELKCELDAQSQLKKVENVAALSSPFLIPTFEAVVAPGYLLAVSAQPRGKTIYEKVPRKARLPWPSALAIGCQVAVAIQTLHLAGLVHGNLTPRTVWLEGKLRSRLRFPWNPDPAFGEIDPETSECWIDYSAPEVIDGDTATPAADAFSLGCLVTRLITGRCRCEGETIQEKLNASGLAQAIAWDKYEVPKVIANMLTRLMDPDPQKRPDDWNEIISLFEKGSGQKIADWPPVESADEEERFRTQLSTGAGFFETDSFLDVEHVSIQEKVSDHSGVRTAEPIKSVEELQQFAKRRNSRQRLITVASVVGFALLSSFVLWLIGQYKYGSSTPQNTSVATKEGTATNESQASSNEPQPVVENLSSNAVLNQYLTDDEQLLWESPTNGEQAIYEFLPANPRIVFDVQVNDVVTVESGKLALESLSSELKTTIDDWRIACGLEWEDISRVVVALFDGDTEFRSLAVVELANRVPTERLISIWNGSVVELANERKSTAYVAGERCYLPIVSVEDSEKLRGFVVGPQDLVTEAADFAGLSSLDGAMADIAAKVDGDRQINILFLSSALFNEQGQALMSGNWNRVNRAMRLLFNENIRGGLLSLHWEGAQVYFELQIDHSVDLKNADAKRWLEEGFSKATSNAENYVAQIVGNVYWNRVRQRFDNMILGLARATRFGVEDDNVIANAWLPASAVHNLIGATDLALRYSSGTASLEPVVVNSGATSFDEVLNSRRELRVTTNPDLNILLQNLQNEVNADNPELPYPFEIVINGNDLLVEGITKNQRPGDFEFEDESLSEILTQIVYRANPDKDATGPGDVRCKLIWVVLEDESNGQKRVEITTRSAAEARGLELPDPFVFSGR
ncbi:MAG: protein kinase [Pirellulaceae bacterium]